MTAMKNRWGIKYAPKHIDDCVLPSSVHTFLDELRKGEYVPNIFFYGSPGTGKTTLSRLLAEECKLETYFLNASLELNGSALRNRISAFASSVSLLGFEGKVIIFDEADRIPKKTQGEMRGWLDEFQTNCSFIMTGNYPEKLIDPIKSRMFSLEIGGLGNRVVDNELKEAIFSRVQKICEEEEVKFNPNVVSRLVDQGFPNVRQIIIDAEMVLKYGAPLYKAA